MKNKIFTLALLMLMITITGVWAQNLPNTPGTSNAIWTSPQSSTTEGRYRSNTDDFIRPDSYLGVKFNKWFGMVSFLSGDEYNSSMIATVGFAGKAGSLYIGALYTGNMWTGAPVNNYTEKELNPGPDGGDNGKVYNVYDSISVGGATNPVNNVALLFGAADMGFRLTFRTNYQLFNKDNIVVGNQLYKNYYAEYGYIAPQIAWAMAKDLTKNGIRPYAAVDLVFWRDYQYTETNGPDSDGISGKKTDTSMNHFDPSLSLGLGGITFYNKDGFKGSLDLDYVLTLNIYDNEYSYVDGDKYKTAKIKGTYSPGSFSYNERNFISNQITPSVSGSWSKDALALKFKLNLPVTLSTDEQKGMELDSSNKLVYNNDSYLYSTFTFQPDIRLAMQYKIVPNRLTLNTGARIQTTLLTQRTVTRTNYNMGTKVSTQKKHEDATLTPATGTQFVSRFNIGPTFYFTENAWVEATTGVTKAYGSEGAINVFDRDGLFSFGSILVAFKF